jgi:uncharacterized repeat protein (TIGR01451 family)
MILALAPLLCGVVFIASQIALDTSQPDTLEVAINPLETANYGPWDFLRIRPVDERIATIAAFERQPTSDATLAPGQTAQPTATFPLVARLPSTTPGLDATATPVNVVVAVTTEADETATALPSETPDADNETPTATLTTTSTGTVTVTTTATLTETVSPTPTLTETVTPTSTPTATLTATSTPTTTPTNTPIPTNTSIPTATQEPLIASFSPSTTSGFAPLAVSFSNTSSGPITGYQWNFGDGSTLNTATSPSHNYTTPGTYLVTLTVFSATGSTQATALISVSSVPPPPQTDLSLTAVASPSTVTTGETITYDFTLTNLSSTAAQTTFLSGSLPSNVTYILSSGCSQSGGTVTCSPGTMAGGASVTYRIVTQSVTAGTAVMAMTASTSTTESNVSNNSASATVTINPVPPTDADLSLTKTASVGTATVGETFTYTLSVTNNGPVNASGVTITDTLPPEVTFDSSPDCSASGSTVTCNIGALANGATGSATVTVTAANPGTAVNSATVAGGQPDPTGGNNSASATVTINPVPPTDADLSLTKTASVGTATVGETFTYTLSVTNNGPVNASGVTITDTLPPEVTFDSSPDCSASGSTVTCNIGALANGATGSATVTVTAANPGTAVNSATVAGGQPDPTGGNNSASASVDIVAPVSVDMEFSTFAPSNLSPLEGDTIEIVLTVRNNGTGTATGVVVAAATGTSVSSVYDSATPSTTQGTYDTITDVWTVGTLAPSATATLTFSNMDILPGSGGATVTRSRTVTANEADPDMSNNTNSYTITIQSNGADLEITNFTPTSASVSVSEPVSLSFDVVNNSTNDATNAIVLFPEPANLLPVLNNCSSLSLAGGTYTCALGTLTAGSTTTVNFTFDATNAGSETTTFTADSDLGDLIPGNNSGSLTTTIDNGADIGISIAANTLTPLENSTVDYTVTIINNGPITANNVTANINYPAGLTETGISSGGGNFAGGASSAVWTFPTLTNGETYQVTITFSIGASAGGNDYTMTASAIADEVDPILSNNNASETVTVQDATDLSITKNASVSSANVGETFTYTLDVTNNGPSDASGVTITDTLPPEVTFDSSPDCSASGSTVTCNIGALANGATGSATVTVTAANAGTAVNNATVAGGQADPTGGNNSASATVTINPSANADLQLSKVASVTTAVVGEQFTYTVTVDNVGPDAANNITIVDTLPAEVTYISGPGACSEAGGIVTCIIPLLGGASGSASVTYTVEAVGAGIAVNSATVSADEADPDTSNNNASETVTVQDATDLSITKNASVSSVNVGQTFTYALDVTNNGPSNASGVTITDTLPPEVTFDSSPDCSASGSTVTCNIGALANGATGSATVTVTAANPGTAVNSATVAGGQADPTGGNNSASATVTINPVQADLEFTTFSADNANPAVGDIVTFTIEIANNGPDDATGIRLGDSNGSGALGTVISITESTGTATANQWDIPLLTSGSTATLTIEVQVVPSAAGTTVSRWREIVASDQTDPDSTPNNGNPGEDDYNSYTVTVQPLESDLAVTKQVNDPTPNEGDPITFIVRASNNGPDDGFLVEVSDLLPTGLTYVSHTVGQGTYDPITGIWDIGDLPSLSPSIALTIEATVDNGTAGQTITNTASISGAGTDTVSSNDSAPVSITVNEPVDLSLNLAFAPTNPTSTVDDVTFDLTVTNNGPIQATGVTVTGTLPDALLFTSGTGCSTTTGRDVTCTLGTITSGGGNASASFVTETYDTGLASYTMTAVANELDSALADNTVTATFNINPLACGASGEPNIGPANGVWCQFNSIVIDLGSSSALRTVPGNDLIYYERETGPVPSGNINMDDVIIEVGVTSSGPWLEVFNWGDGIPSTNSSIASYATDGDGELIDEMIPMTTPPLSGTPPLVTGIGIDVDAVVPPGIYRYIRIRGTTHAFDAIQPLAVAPEPTADLSVGLTPDPVNVDLGDSLILYLTTFNNGPDATSGITTTVALPSLLSVVSLPPNCTNTSGTITCDVGTQASGTGVTYEIVVDAANLGSGTITASTSGVQFDSNIGNNSTSVPVTINNVQADLQLTKSGPGAVVVSNNFDYTFSVTNTGTADATTVTITDTLPSEVTFVSSTECVASGQAITCNLGTVTSGGGTANAAVTVQAVTPGTITNTATVSSAGTDANPADNTDSATVTINPRDLRLVALCTPEPSSYLRWRVDNFNPYPITFDWQELFGSASGVETVPAASLPTRGQVIFTTPPMSNLQIFVSGVLQDTNNPSGAICDVDLAVNKVVNNPTPTTGETVTFTITVSNNDTYDASGLVVNDILPAGLQYAGDSPTAGLYDSVTGDWSVGTLLVGQTHTLELQALANSAGNYTNTATITTANQPDANTGNNSASVAVTVTDPCPCVDVDVTKSVLPLAPPEDSTAVYTINVQNNGPDTATGVEVTDNLPTGVTYFTHSTSQGPYSPSTGLWSVGTLANGQSETLTVVVYVDTGTQGSTLSNTAVLTNVVENDTNSANDSDSASINPVAPTADIAVNGTVNNPTPNPGETVTFMINAINGGASRVSTLTLDIILPSASYSLISASTVNGTFSGSTWDVGSLDSGDTALLSITAIVDPGVASGATILNEFRVNTSQYPDPNPANDVRQITLTVN